MTSMRAGTGLVDTQRPDGSRGRWQDTQEETAHALQTLPAACTPPDRDVVHAASHGCGFRHSVRPSAVPRSGPPSTPSRADVPRPVTASGQRHDDTAA
ncbi:hypothetical protein GCM10023083_12300 [Streptomyces phyllanthi]